jgi:hypothetical protein
MLRAVQLNNKLGLMTVKINKIAPKDFLPVELLRIVFLIIVPKTTLFFGHVPASVLG